MTSTPATWLVTGSSSGLGRALTETLLHNGHRVAATARDTTRLDDLKDTFADQLWTAKLDVIDTARLREVTDAAFTDLGRIDHVVSNAAHGQYGGAEEVSDEDIDRLFAANLKAPIQLLRSTLPHLRRQGSGRFVQISSAAGHFGMAGASLYNASKWGVEGFFESLHDELAPFGVGVTIVDPGSIASNFFARLNVAPPIEAYNDGPVGDLRRYLSNPDAVKSDSLGDPVKMAQAIMNAVTDPQPPRRLVLGSDSFPAIEQAVSARLAEIRAQEDLARSTDR